MVMHFHQDANWHAGEDESGPDIGCLGAIH
jgi:hypothetical protein